MSDRAALPLFTRTGFLEPPAASSAARWQWFLENPGGFLFELKPPVPTGEEVVRLPERSPPKGT